jgi:hypothetical protein
LDNTKDESQIREDEIESLQVQMNKLSCDKNDIRREYIEKMTVIENEMDRLYLEMQKLKNQR